MDRTYKHNAMISNSLKLLKALQIALHSFHQCIERQLHGNAIVVRKRDRLFEVALPLSAFILYILSVQIVTSSSDVKSLGLFLTQQFIATFAFGPACFYEMAGWQFRESFFSEHRSGQNFPFMFANDF